jgi:hypothetical protein
MILFYHFSISLSSQNDILNKLSVNNLQVVHLFSRSHFIKKNFKKLTRTLIL